MGQSLTNLVQIGQKGPTKIKHIHKFKNKDQVGHGFDLWSCFFSSQICMVLIFIHVLFKFLYYICTSMYLHILKAFFMYFNVVV